MPQFRDPLRFYKHMEKQFEANKTSFLKAHAWVSEQGHKDAMELTSGKTSQEQLNRENNPYGHGAVSPSGRKRRSRPLLPINAHTPGGLQSRIKLTKRTSTALQRFELSAQKHPGNWVLSPAGTRRMRARGFWKELEKRWRQRNLAMRRLMQRGAIVR